MSDAMDLMEARRLADDILRGRRRVPRMEVDRLAVAFQLCDRLRAEAVQQVQETERCFREGNLAAEAEQRQSPYKEGSHENHWWTRGFSYVARLTRAIIAEAGQAEAVHQIKQLKKEK